MFLRRNVDESFESLNRKFQLNVDVHGEAGDHAIRPYCQVGYCCYDQCLMDVQNPVGGRIYGKRCPELERQFVVEAAQRKRN